MSLSIRSAVLDAVSAAGPEASDAGPPKPPAPSEPAVAWWKPKGGLPAPGGFEAQLSFVLGALDERRPGSNVVAGSLKQALMGALLAPGLDATTRETRVLEALLPMLQAGRGPALVGLRTVLESNLPQTPATREALRGALDRIGAAAAEGATDAVTVLSEKAPIPGEAIRDVARLGWLLNQGTEAQRSEAVMRVLLLDARTPMGAVCAKARSVVLDDGSRHVRLSSDERELVQRLMREWPSASPARRAALVSENGLLFNTLERALGGAMVGSPPGFAREQAEKGNPLPSWLSDPRSATLENDLSLMTEAERLAARLTGGGR